MALKVRTGGSQSPDRWLREPRNNQSANISEGQTVTIKEVPGTPTPETPGTTTKTSNPPKTGDTANAILWIAILVLSAAGITVVRIWNKKKQVKRLGIEEKKEEEE